MTRLMIRKDVYDELMKAFGHKDMSKLTEKQIIDKNGHTKKVWVRMGEEPKKERAVSSNEDYADSMTKKFKVGAEIEYRFGGNLLSGEIVAQGTKGVQARDSSGNVRKIDYADISAVTKNSDGTIPSEKFNADDYKKSFTDPRATNDVSGYKYIYDSLGETGKEAAIVTVKRLEEQTKRLIKYKDTDSRYKDKDGNYLPERRKLHEKIISEYLSPEKIKNATPKNGEKPKFVMFGGRGGSGKSWFTDKKRAATEGRKVMFDSDKFLVLDADAIKEYLPEYEGWNAGEVHEESSYINKEIKKRAMSLGLNIIIDGTMNYNPRKPDKVRNEMLEAKGKGYSLEAHYMFLPVQESAKRAINRFKTKKGDFSGRLVPMEILMGMQDNEKSFDSVKDIVDDWSFRDNQGVSGPKLISWKK